MNIVLTSELEQFVQERLESGNYQDALAVILEGLRLLEEQERIYKGRFDSLKREIMIGVEAADRGELLDGETVFAELEEDTRQIESQMQQA